MTTEDIIALALVYLIIVVSLGVSLTCKKKGVKVDYRKIVHIGVGNFVFVWWAFSASWIMLVFFVIPFAVVLAFAMMKDNKVAKSEIGELSHAGHTEGLFLYAVSIGILVFFLFTDHWTAATIGIVAMTYGDGFGGVIGKRFGKHRLLEGKSLEGSIGVFAATAIVSAVVLLFYGWLITSGYFPRGDVTGLIPWWGLALTAGATCAVLEAVTPGRVDNLANSIGTAVVMVLLGL